MPPKRERSTWLTTGSEDGSDFGGHESDPGYDSEAADLGLRKARDKKILGSKKDDKTLYRGNDENNEEEEGGQRDAESSSESDQEEPNQQLGPSSSSTTTAHATDRPDEDLPTEAASRSPQAKRRRPKSDEIMSDSTKRKEPAIPNSQPSKESSRRRPGIIYLPSLPPHIKPSALKHLLEQRGFSPVSRLFLTPTRGRSNSSKSQSRSRKSYGEGWLEFPSHKTAKRCVETLNAAPIGGPKRGYYHDDLWNMRYLRGMTWTDLMGQIREERREEEVRKGEERRIVKREVEQFLQGVDRSKREKTIQNKKKRRRTHSDGEPSDSRAGVDSAEADDSVPPPSTTPPSTRHPTSFQWKQFQVKGNNARRSGSGSGSGRTISSSDSTIRTATQQQPSRGDDNGGGRPHDVSITDPQTSRVLGMIF